jgi:PKHD-type hydroxylase
MNLKNYYYFFQSAIPERICDDIVKYAKQKKDKIAKIGKYQKITKLNKKEIKDLKEVRDSNIVWLNDNWIYKEIHPFLNNANVSAGWNFDWDFSEACQFTKYKKGQFYNWHCDSYIEPFHNQNNPLDPINHKIRKLSISVNLSNPKDYKGGELQFDFRNTESKKREIKTCKEILPKGSLIVFPSFVWHRVSPVTSGERNSLVMWNLGYPFK